jgi:phosphonate transport system ATP-binding protein
MIQVEDLEVVFPNGTRALAPISALFRTGEFTVLLGASGAGKSTLLRTLNGLVQPTRGTVHITGVGALSAKAVRAHRRRTGMVFQQHQLIGRASVLTNVLMGRLGYHASLRTLLPLPLKEKQLALEAIERVGLIDYALRRADQLAANNSASASPARWCRTRASCSPTNR